MYKKKKNHRNVVIKISELGEDYSLEKSRKELE